MYPDMLISNFMLQYSKPVDKNGIQLTAANVSYIQEWFFLFPLNFLWMKRHFDAASKWTLGCSSLIGLQNPFATSLVISVAKPSVKNAIGYGTNRQVQSLRLVMMKDLQK